MTIDTGHLNGFPVTAGTVTEPAEVGTTIVLADDQAVVREGLRSMLTATGKLTAVAEAATVHETITQTLRHRPGVLVLGLSLPHTKLRSVVKEVLRSLPQLNILVFSAAEDDDAVSSALSAGARGYIGKSTAAPDIVRAVETVAAGWGVFTPETAGSLAHIAERASKVDERPFPELTDREREVLDLLAAGTSNLGIARQLHLAAKTVSNHISRIFAKLGVADRSSAIVRAREAGLGT